MKMIGRIFVHRFLINHLKFSTRSIAHFKGHESESVDQKQQDNMPTEKLPNVDDISADLNIEANLFKNSTLINKPMLTKLTLRDNDRNLKEKISSKKRAYQIETIKDSELNMQYVRLNSNDATLSTIMTRVRSKKRRNNSEIIVEGHRLLCEALECKLHLNTIIFSQRNQILKVKDEIKEAELRQSSPIQIFKVPHHDLKMWSTLSTPPGLLGIFRRPSADSIFDHILNVQNVPTPITVICDNVRSPDNLGSIIRTCSALPCYQVIITRGCCDPWETKALRSGCGGQFRVPIQDDIDWQNVPALLPPNTDCHVYVAENNIKKVMGMSNQLPIVDFVNIKNIGEHNVVIIGGETHGVSCEAYSFLNAMATNCKCVHIPLAAGIDSLNVNAALTLILFELRKHTSFSFTTTT